MFGMFARQARELGIKLPLFNFESFEDASEVKASKDALVGQWYVNADDPYGDFFKEYAARYPGASLYGAGNGHDVALLLAAAIDKDSSREGINRFLHEVKNFKGTLGTFSASGDNRFTLPAAVKVVTKDGFKKL